MGKKKTLQNMILITYTEGVIIAYEKHTATKEKLRYASLDTYAYEGWLRFGFLNDWQKLKNGPFSSSDSGKAKGGIRLGQLRLSWALSECAKADCFLFKPSTTNANAPNVTQLWRRAEGAPGTDYQNETHQCLKDESPVQSSILHTNIYFLAKSHSPTHILIVWLCSPPLLSTCFREK